MDNTKFSNNSLIYLKKKFFTSTTACVPSSRIDGGYAAPFKHLVEQLRDACGGK